MKGCIKPISVPNALKSYPCRTVYSKHLQQPDYLAETKFLNLPYISVFIQSFNGKSVFLSDNWISSDHLKLFTDASANIGYVAVFGSWWTVYSKHLQQPDYLRETKLLNLPYISPIVPTQ
jgi:hypothetical protein